MRSPEIAERWPGSPPGMSARCSSSWYGSASPAAFVFPGRLSRGYLPEVLRGDAAFPVAVAEQRSWLRADRDRSVFVFPLRVAVFEAPCPAPAGLEQTDGIIGVDAVGTSAVGDDFGIVG